MAALPFIGALTELDTFYAEGGAQSVRVGGAAMQGWRDRMEDSHLFDLDFAKRTALVGVFDGHGGPEVGEFVRRHFKSTLLSFYNDDSEAEAGDALTHTFLALERRLEEAAREEERQRVRGEGGGKGGAGEVDAAELRTIEEERWQQDVGRYSRALLSTPHIGKEEGDGEGGRDKAEMVAAMMQSRRDKHHTSPAIFSGTTAIAVMVGDDSFTCASVGDSRAVLCRGGDIIPLAFDHKPTLHEERVRIAKAGARVVEGRINGLNMTRALGGFYFKHDALHLPIPDRAISAVPRIVTVPRHADDEFLVVASDGVWDVADNYSCIRYVRDRLVLKNEGVTSTMQRLVNDCLAKSVDEYGTDNMTAIAVDLRPSSALLGCALPRRQPWVNARRQRCVWRRYSTHAATTSKRIAERRGANVRLAALAHHLRRTLTSTAMRWR